MSALREAAPAVRAEPDRQQTATLAQSLEGPDEKLLDLVGAALKRFGPTLTVTYRNGGAQCVLAFPLDSNKPQTSESQT